MNLPTDLNLYQCSRKTFGAHWVLSGGSMEKLSLILGHASVTTTERHYCALRPDMFSAADVARIDVDISRPEGELIDLAAHRKTVDGAIGCGVGADQIDAEKTAT